MDATRVALLREALASTGWIERAGAFGRELCQSTRTPGGLLLVGTPEEEPWHLAAHLQDESQWHDLPSLQPTLVRWSPPGDAPPHLNIGMDRIEQAGRGETIFVVAPQRPTAPLLERAADARRAGANVFALASERQEAGGRTEANDLDDVAHDTLSVPRGEEAVSFDAVSHLISSPAGFPPAAPGRRGLRSRLARLLDAVSGPATPD